MVILNGLQPGTYYYKFIVDGVWAIDPLAPKASKSPAVVDLRPVTWQSCDLAAL